jgi:hypothetical protein
VFETNLPFADSNTKVRIFFVFITLYIVSVPIMSICVGVLSSRAGKFKPAVFLAWFGAYIFAKTFAMGSLELSHFSADRWYVIPVGIAQAFGGSRPFAIGITVAPMIFYPILAFSPAPRYQYNPEKAITGSMVWSVLLQMRPASSSILLSNSSLIG